MGGPTGEIRLVPRHFLQSEKNKTDCSGWMIMRRERFATVPPTAIRNRLR